ncbi:monocarboxylate transporter 4-like [Gigantopelta aegis]|uniref:monocarboxylate transporter 4-like n=1 Tax=Gigantopelta aegis TaxID=1735272 RepID=UPI001B88B0B9|nr:monocarboxylate transporter 4-like [Gigantopelta aegis]
MVLSVFFVEIIDTFQGSRAQTSLIQSFCLTVLLGSGALGSVLLSRFGVMRIGLFGGVLATVGCVAASFAPSVLVLVVCIGALTGALRDLTGTYDAFLYVTMSASLASSASLFVVWCFKKKSIENTAQLLLIHINIVRLNQNMREFFRVFDIAIL